MEEGDSRGAAGARAQGVAPAQRPGKQQRWKEGPGTETQISQLKAGDTEGTSVEVSGVLFNLPSSMRSSQKERRISTTVITHNFYSP